MKRSVQVSAPLLASAALAILSGCRQPEMQRCVDEQNHVVADSFCTSQQTPRPTGGFPYRFYYGGLGGYALGSTVSGGSYSGLSGHAYATSTTRGGFGSSHSGGSSGEGEGAGE